MYPEEGSFEEVYSGKGREDLVDNDEISAEEEAFMSGYDDFKEDDDVLSEADDEYEQAFAKKKRRSKRRVDSFDEEELLNEIEMR